VHPVLSETGKPRHAFQVEANLNDDKKSRRGEPGRL
jgi:hypothetical protein